MRTKTAGLVVLKIVAQSISAFTDVSKMFQKVLEFRELTDMIHFPEHQCAGNWLLRFIAQLF